MSSHDVVLQTMYSEVRGIKERIVTTLLTKHFTDLSEVARLQGEYQGVEEAVRALEQANEEHDV